MFTAMTVLAWNYKASYDGKPVQMIYADIAFYLVTSVMALIIDISVTSILVKVAWWFLTA